MTVGRFLKIPIISIIIVLSTRYCSKTKDENSRVTIPITSNIVILVGRCLTDHNYDICRKYPKQFYIRQCANRSLGHGENTNVTVLINAFRELKIKRNIPPPFHDQMIHEILLLLSQNSDIEQIFESDIQMILNNLAKKSYINEIDYFASVIVPFYIATVGLYLCMKELREVNLYINPEADYRFRDIDESQFKCILKITIHDILQTVICVTLKHDLISDMVRSYVKHRIIEIENPSESSEQTDIIFDFVRQFTEEKGISDTQDQIIPGINACPAVTEEYRDGLVALDSNNLDVIACNTRTNGVVDNSFPPSTNKFSVKKDVAEKEGSVDAIVPIKTDSYNTTTTYMESHQTTRSNMLIASENKEDFDVPARTQ
ncbi:hypothetical protein RF11_07146 [Thelohanellus kitauei]|uniref:Uncharacterized protein n=1 Tax=Thelohanellus kitauei TaxID=669202 RepID=A0A0C2MSR5_THEKT|nr:hypothetical protein RF11_07146 [Thelohanellus kitauei]